MQSLTQGLLPWHCKTNGSGHKRRTLHQSDAHTLDWPGGRKTKIIHCTKTKRHKQSHQRFLLNPESHLRTEPSAPACPKQSHLLPDLPCLSAVETERLQMWGGASDLFFFLPPWFQHPPSLTSLWYDSNAECDYMWCIKSLQLFRASHQEGTSHPRSDVDARLDAGSILLKSRSSSLVLAGHQLLLAQLSEDFGPNICN